MEQEKVNPLSQGIVRIAFGLENWLQGMKDYTDKQYGKSEIRELRNQVFVLLLNQYPDVFFEFVFEPKTGWIWDRSKYEFVAVLPVEACADYSFKMNFGRTNTSAVVFAKPARGILVLKEK